MSYRTIDMNTTEIIDTFIEERGNSKNTSYAYLQSMRVFEKYIGMTLSEFIEKVEDEQDKGISWKRQLLRQTLIGYRKHLYNNYKKQSAKHYFSRLKAVLRHYEIEIQSLPYYSTKKAEPSVPINPDKMLDREILKLCINVKNPLLRALVLFMSSTGMSKTDTLQLTVQDFIEATKEYHNTNHLPNILHMLAHNHQAVGVWENFKREKTGRIYFTFNSPESTIAISQYLMTREHLYPDSPLFNVSYKYMSDLFKETNDQLGLGKNGPYSRFASHMLRRYHATQLEEAGMDSEKINILQGRKPKTIAFQSYIKIKPSKLKNEYIEALPYLVIEDYTKVKTELDVTKDKLDKATSKNIELQNDLNDIFERLEKLEEEKPTWEEYINQEDHV